MRNIEELVPEAGHADAVGLREVDAAELARYAVDPAHPWWRRRPCVHALAGRVPEGHVADLIARVRDSGDVGEVRIALLDLLAGREELLPWLRHEDRRREESYGLPEAILKARGLLGDRSAAAELAALAASPWPRQQALGAAGLDALVTRYGAEAVLADVGDERPEDRAFRIRTRHGSGADVTDALADPDRGVAYLAQSLVSDADRLRRYLGEAPTTGAKLWTAYALHRITGDAAETRTIYDGLGRPRVEVAGLDEEVRSAIVHAYASGCQRNSDPRWRVEALCTDPPFLPDEDERLRRATAALTTAGLAPRAPISCGEFHQQGGGTYHVIECGAGRVFVSTLGMFASAAESEGGTEGQDAVREALAAAGFRWIDTTTGAIRVTDLCVYHFGGRGPLDVDTLLFYWQD
ncbi:hypothetical protein ABZ567_21460 [Streptomyces sp. NPDC016459]|uniref:hypothetical protein n=1 Tax=Streptomyces sp. NPDC016459 TaxID=3157190 RepID=UPI0033F9FE1D